MTAAQNASGRCARYPLLGLVVLVLSTATYFSLPALVRKEIQTFETKSEFCLQDKGSDEKVGTIRTIPTLMINDSTPFFDPFTQWTLRADVTNQSVREVLYRIDHDAACQESLYFQVRRSGVRVLGC